MARNPNEAAINGGPELFEPVLIQRQVRSDSSNVHHNLNRPSSGPSPKYGTNGRQDKEIEEFFQKMKTGTERLWSFRVGNWPVSFITPKECAEAGFFYLMNRDRVQCAFCRGVVCGWEPGDVPLEEHERHFPRCPFLMEYNVGNIPIEEDPVRGPNRKRGHDVCGNQHFSLSGEPSREPTRSSTSVSHNSNNGHNPRSASQPSSIDFKRYGVQPHSGPKHTEFVSFESRIRSFSSEWPKDAPVKPKELCEAGFFYIGVSDYVKCFYCDGGLCNWTPGDEPWAEHSCWFPDCQYVRLNKGDAFIEASQLRSANRTEQSNGIHPTDDKDLAVEVVDKWLNSDIVLQLEDLYSFSKNVVKAVLHKRWLDKQRPFESFGELYEAVSKFNGNLCSRSEQSRRPVSSDEDEENRSSQESEASSASSLSPPSSSPSDSIGYMSSEAEDHNRLLCKICLDREIGVVFLPCGHLVACTQCAPGMSDCPICRQVIRGTVRTFLP